MKKMIYIFAVATVCLVSCSYSDEILENDNQQPENGKVTYIRAENNEAATTRGYVDNSTAAFTWKQGDRIAVWADGYKISDPLASGDNGKSSVDFAFSGGNSVTQGNRANFAIYPASLVWDGSSIRTGSADNYVVNRLTLTLPGTYDLADVQDDAAPTPMIATNAPDGNLSFKALCPLLR